MDSTEDRNDGRVGVARSAGGQNHSLAEQAAVGDVPAEQAVARQVRTETVADGHVVPVGYVGGESSVPPAAEGRDVRADRLERIRQATLGRATLGRATAGQSTSGQSTLDRSPSGQSSSGDRLTPTVRRWIANVFLAILLLTVYRWARTTQEGGHDWGDDFSLYLRQAKALAQGYTGQVVADTHFSVSNSGWTYSPNAYPWAWPMMMMPIVARWGLDYAKLKMLVTLIFLAFLFLFHRIVRKRVGELLAFLLVACIGTNFFFVTWTNGVLSEFPFLAAVALALVCFDRYQRRGSLWNASRKPAIVLGLSMALAANVRREAFALPLGLVVAHLIEFVWPKPLDGTPHTHAIWPIERFRKSFRDFVKKAYVPYAVFAGAVAVWQFLMPSDLLPTADTSSRKNIGINMRWYKGILAEHTGLKDAGDTPLRVASHSAARDAWGSRLFTILVVLAVLGVVLRVVLRPREDGWLAGAMLGIGYVVFASPFHDGRYLYALSPWVLYFAAQGLPSVADGVTRLVGRTGGARATATGDRISGLPLGRAIATGFTALFLCTLIYSNWPGLSNAVKYHRAYRYTENGPELPESQEMFAAVRTYTSPDDVILFFRSRAMMLYTDRRAVQNSDVVRMRSVADWYVMERGSTYGQAQIQAGDEARVGVEKVWENSRWVLWRFLPYGPGEGPIEVAKKALRAKSPAAAAAPAGEVPLVPATRPTPPVTSPPAPVVPGPTQTAPVPTQNPPGSPASVQALPTSPPGTIPIIDPIEPQSSV